MKYPQVKHCQPNLWCRLSNGWIVGPIIDTNFPGVYIKFNKYGETFQVDVMGQDRVDEKSPRLVVGVGYYDELNYKFTQYYPKEKTGNQFNYID